MSQRLAKGKVHITKQVRAEIRRNLSAFDCFNDKFAANCGKSPVRFGFSLKDTLKYAEFSPKMGAFSHDKNDKSIHFSVLI